MLHCRFSCFARTGGIMAASCRAAICTLQVPIHSLAHSLTHLLADPLTRPHICSQLTHMFAHPLTCSPAVPEGLRLQSLGGAPQIHSKSCSGSCMVTRLLRCNLCKNDVAGQRRRWDMISSHSSVGVIIYHTELDALIVVRQFRPPVSFLLLVFMLVAKLPVILCHLCVAF